MRSETIFCLLLTFSSILADCSSCGDDGDLFPKKEPNGIFGKNTHLFKSHILGTVGITGFDKETLQGRKKILGELIVKMDSDKDGFVTEDELRAYFKQSKYEMHQNYVTIKWKMHNPKGYKKLTWTEYSFSAYKDLIGLSKEEKENDKNKLSHSQQKKDMARWAIVDKEDDGTLDKEEFSNFINPQYSEKGIEILSKEMMEEHDKNKDEKIELNEYLVYFESLSDSVPKDAIIKSQRQQFEEIKDANKDGHLDMDEVREVIINGIKGQDIADKRNAENIFEKADTDLDKKLSINEFFKIFDITVEDAGSKATGAHTEL